MSGVLTEPLPTSLGNEGLNAKMNTDSRQKAQRGSLFVVRRVTCFIGVIAVLAFGLDAIINSGLRQIKTSQYGASNRIMEGKVNAQIVVTGSSRAVSHYDPRIIETQTGRSAFNLGRNGSQTDMQVAVLKAYLEHNRKPDIVIHNLDAFTFVTTREVYAPAQYVPYLYDEELYRPLRKINPDTWKSRYVPLYGYVVDDMNFSWILGLKGFFGWSPREDFFLGFNPRSKKWTDDFQRFKAENPDGVSWGIEPAGIQLMDDLIRLCQKRGIQLIFVYSPEYAEMQKLTKNRTEVFHNFHKLADRNQVPLWNYSDWSFASDTDYFTNSQHLNAEGAAIFSEDVANRLKGYFAAQSGTAASLQASK
jgi:hypothetical protein